MCLFYQHQGLTHFLMFCSKAVVSKILRLPGHDYLRQGFQQALFRDKETYTSFLTRSAHQKNPTSLRDMLEERNGSYKVHASLPCLCLKRRPNQRQHIHTKKLCTAVMANFSDRKPVSFQFRKFYFEFKTIK